MSEEDAYIGHELVFYQRFLMAEQCASFSQLAKGSGPGFPTGTVEERLKAAPSSVRVSRPSDEQSVFSDRGPESASSGEDSSANAASDGELLVGDSSKFELRPACRLIPRVDVPRRLKRVKRSSYEARKKRGELDPSDHGTGFPTETSGAGDGTGFPADTAMVDCYAAHHKARVKALRHYRSRVSEGEDCNEVIASFGTEFGDIEEEMELRSCCMVHAEAQYIRDVESTGGQNIRAWKRIMRDRVKARMHRIHLVDAFQVHRGADPNAIVPPYKSAQRAAHPDNQHRSYSKAIVAKKAENARLSCSTKPIPERVSRPEKRRQVRLGIPDRKYRTSTATRGGLRSTRGMRLRLGVPDRTRLPQPAQSRQR